MSDFDLVIRAGTIVTPRTEFVGDIGIAEGTILAIEPNLSGSTQAEIEATELHIFPGLIDPHVHFNEPGRADWEGIETGSSAFAAGGGTLYFDMPLNAHPPTCDASTFALKKVAAERSSATDFAFWGGLVPGNLDQLDGLADCGVIGFKAFMSDSGIADFLRVDENALREGMKRAARLNLPVAVHAESETLTKRLAAERMAAGKVSPRDYLESRPIAAELEAIRQAIDLAGETGCKLHIVHVSNGQGIALVSEARKAGVDVSCETCPHYLTLTEDEVFTLGAIAKCAPPLRSKSVQGELWSKLLAGEITMIGSDHSPCPPEMKNDQNFFKIWGGISGVQHTLPFVFEGRSREGFSLSQIAKLTSHNIAERFRLPKTIGQIMAGADANLALINLSDSFQLRAEDLLCRHKQSPYLGRTLTGKVVQTILRGETIFANGKIVRKCSGQLIKPV